MTTNNDKKCSVFAQRIIVYLCKGMLGVGGGGGVGVEGVGE